MKISVKRAYDPAEPKDGTRVLVDRLWPRGVTKADARIDVWAKDIAPTNELRKWFHADPEKRFAEFAKRYEAELAENPALPEFRKQMKAIRGAVTLITAAKDPSLSHVAVIRKHI
ncbi:MAG TPA: DUF488 family protein [Candidatus Paceibacterota bacterium]|nr:DUF488 family protein [Candidatus Paceibacterota bacterium]